MSIFKKSEKTASVLPTENLSSKKSYNKKLGVYGERKAEDYLKRAGLKILQKNYRCKSGEIDLIVRDGDEIVFVEVKTRSNTSAIMPCEAVNSKKQQHIRDSAMCFVEEQRINSNFRFDIVEVYVSVRMNYVHLDRINYIKDAFQ